VHEASGAAALARRDQALVVQIAARLVGLEALRVCRSAIETAGGGAARRRTAAAAEQHQDGVAEAALTMRHCRSEAPAESGCCIA